MNMNRVVYDNRIAKVKSMRNEKDLEQECVKYAREAGVRVVKLERTGNDGIPDRMFVKKGGDVLFVEFKNPNGRGRLSESQKDWLDFIGVKAVVCSSFDRFKELID